ncbi:hypothetical protein IU436_25490 [Nocardia farcinica]|uniref:hypothetical protein n=1 Tax=Nocardia farcinica TaxID=37329 RepID=UPI001894202F|nr:hypothetical protein [Nocardia farcinica]MBF6422048.1 hypothetical protein [Nocardia farcinica]MBF6433704.1 hypothetical protein [Nocardia farcinica]MBF6504678.1 hypothetical protein [Nocardia farcinica]
MRTALAVAIAAGVVALAGCATESESTTPAATTPPTTPAIMVTPVGQYVVTQPRTYTAGREIPAGLTWTGLSGNDDCRYQRTWKGRPQVVQELRSALTFGDPADAVTPVADTFLILEGDSLEILGDPDDRPCVFWADADQGPADSPAPWDGALEQVRSLSWVSGEAGYLISMRAQAPGVADSELVDMGMWVCWTDSKYGARDVRDAFVPMRTAMRQYAGMSEQQSATVVDVARALLCPRS